MHNHKQRENYLYAIFTIIVYNLCKISLLFIIIIVINYSKSLSLYDTKLFKNANWNSRRIYNLCTISSWQFFLRYKYNQRFWLFFCVIKSAKFYFLVKYSETERIEIVDDKSRKSNGKFWNFINNIIKLKEVTIRILISTSCTFLSSSLWIQNFHHCCFVVSAVYTVLKQGEKCFVI